MRNEIARSLSSVVTVVGLIVAVGGVGVLLGRKTQDGDRQPDDGTPPADATIDEQQQWIGEALGQRGGSLTPAELRWLRSHRDLVRVTLRDQSRRQEPETIDAASLIREAGEVAGQRAAVTAAEIAAETMRDEVFERRLQAARLRP